MLIKKCISYLQDKTQPENSGKLKGKHLYWILFLNGSRYSRMDQVKFVEDSLLAEHLHVTASEAYS